MPGSLDDFDKQYDFGFNRLFQHPMNSVVSAFRSLNQKNSQEDKYEQKEFGIFLMSNERRRGNIYVSKDSKNCIMYTLVPHEGEIFENISTSLPAPDDFTDQQAFTLLNFQNLKDQILKIATAAGYIRSFDESLNVYQANHHMRSAIQLFYHQFRDLTDRFEAGANNPNAKITERQDCFKVAFTYRMDAIDFFQTIEGNLQKWGLKKAMQMAAETVSFTKDELVRFHQDKMYDLLKNMPYGIVDNETLSSYDYKITSQQMLLNAIKMLRPDQQIKLLALCLDRRTALGSHFWLDINIDINKAKATRNEARSLLEKLDPTSPALQLTNLRTTCVGFIDPGPAYRQDWLKSSSSADCTRRVGLKIKDHPETVYLLEKREALKAISTLPVDDQLRLLKECLDPLHVLGNRFWEQEGENSCKLTSGTLKTISDKLKELERSLTPGRFGEFKI